MSEIVRVSIDINGRRYAADVPVRLLLADFIRDHARLTGTHLGCEHGVCGACTVHLDGAPVRACLLLAVQADGRTVATVESLAAPNGDLHPLQAAFREAHGLQCGFCTPGFLMALEPYIREAENITEPGIREALSGNICRCTGYQGIVEAAFLAAGRMRPRPSIEDPVRS